MSAAPNPIETVLAVATIVRAGDPTGNVEPDPIFAEDYLPGFAQMVMVDGVPDGVVIEHGPEEAEERTGKRDGTYDGTASFATILLHVIVGYNPFREPDSSLVYFGRKVESIKEEFRKRASYQLGFASDGYEVKQFLPFAPNGYQRVRLDAGSQVHYALLELRYWVRRS